MGRKISACTTEEVSACVSEVGGEGGEEMKGSPVVAVAACSCRGD